MAPNDQPVGKTRCPWSEGVDEQYLSYHDTEWGVPVRDDRSHFEFLILESAQAGLSWRTILRKRAGYRRALSSWAPRSFMLTCRLRDSSMTISSIASDMPPAPTATDVR